MSATTEAVTALASGGAGDLLAARWQMAFTLGTHIILVPFGVALPFIVLIAHWRGLKKGDATSMLLARRWSKIMAVLFAVGAVTGTVLSFEMGLLWPGLMGPFGDVFGLPFAIEGIFFFLEAIFISIYLFGWKRLKGWRHFWVGVPLPFVAIGGTFAIISANSWMNQPQGFTLGPDGVVTDVDPLAAIFNPAVAYQFPHMLLAAYMVAGFVLASVYAVGMLRGRRDRYHRIGFLIPFTVACIATPIQIFVGDFAARAIADDQPIKFAAMELVTDTGPNKPEILGGFLIDGEVRYGIPIPSLASILTGGSPDTVITGLNSVPPEDRPPANVVHWAWDIMVGIGTGLLLLALFFGVYYWRRRKIPESKWFLRACAVSGVGAVVAMEAGWIVTEVGRQPWVVYQVLRTEDAVTTSGGVWISLIIIVVLYTALAIGLVMLLRGMSRRWRRESLPELAEENMPYGPSPPVPTGARPE